MFRICSPGCLGPVYITPKNFENGAFTLKTYHIYVFCPQIDAIESGNVTITGFVFEDSARKITWLLWYHRLRNSAFLNCYPHTHSNAKRAFSKSSGLKRVLEKLRFSLKPYKYSCVFKFYSGAMWTGRH